MLSRVVGEASQPRYLGILRSFASLRMTYWRLVQRFPSGRASGAARSWPAEASLALAAFPLTQGDRPGVLPPKRR